MMLQHRFSRSCRVSFRARLLLVHAFAEPAPLVHDQPAGGHRRHRPSQRRGGTPPSREARREETAPLRALPNRRAYASVRVAVQSRVPSRAERVSHAEARKRPARPAPPPPSLCAEWASFQAGTGDLAGAAPAQDGKHSEAAPVQTWPSQTRSANRLTAPKKRNRARSRAAKPRRFSMGSSAKAWISGATTSSSAPRQPECACGGLPATRYESTCRRRAARRRWLLAEWTADANKPPARVCESASARQAAARRRRPENRESEAPAYRNPGGGGGGRGNGVCHVVTVYHLQQVRHAHAAAAVDPCRLGHPPAREGSAAINVKELSPIGRLSAADLLTATVRERIPNQATNAQPCNRL